MKDVRDADEDGLLALTGYLPAEAAEAVLELATGGTPYASKAEPAPIGTVRDPFTHPDAQRRFRVVTSVEELERAMDAPWDKWAVFLHPEQRQLVTRDFNGPARVAGSAGTGKTVVALHRAVHLARTMPDCRILLATFSEPLAHALRTNVKRLIGNEPRVLERLEVHAMGTLGLRLHQAQLGPVRLASSEDVNTLLREAARAAGDHKFSPLFLRTEWNQVVDAWQLGTWEAYRDVQRLGRRTRLPEARREVLWAMFEKVRAGLKARGLMTESAVFQALADGKSDRAAAFDAAVVDEAQDISIAQLRFLAALGGSRPNALFFSGDLGQRIFQQPFSWKALGVDGRSKTLRVNYRTSHQIREQADRLLGAEMTDADGNREDRRHTVSVFNGPPPEIRTFPAVSDESGSVGDWLRSLANDGIQPHEIGVFVRSPAQVSRATAARQRRRPGRARSRQSGRDQAREHQHRHHASGQGAGIPGVAVMACDDEVLPLQERIENVGDDGDLQEVYDTERQLLYVACTRARDRLSISGVEPASEFLDDVKG
jgi:superfamily I DNA/RNA helicase